LRSLNSMATFVVTSTADGGAGSLRDAIDLANATAGDDTIQLTAGLTYNLTLAPDNDNLNVGGDLDITAAEGLVIEAIGGGNATIDASGIPMGDRIFDVRSGAATLTIMNLTLTGGDVPARGGAIRLVNNATLNVTDSEITGNSAGDGGGIGGINGNIITITGSTISGNTVDGDGGGVYVNSISGMNPNPTLTIVDSNISNNTADNDGGGIFAFNNNTLTITNSEISGNTSDSDGGGVFSEDYNTLTITNSEISGNTASSEGGGLYAEDNNTITITNSQLINNTADYGGGLYADDDNTATITSSTISGNVALVDDGGGLYFDDYAIVEIIDSTISGNSAADSGGGFHAESGADVTITNSTVSGNTASYAGGGIYIQYDEGDPSTLTISHSTIAFNSATVAGGGIANDFDSTLNIDNSIVALNTSSNSPDIGNLGMVVSNGFNLIGDNTGVAAEFPAGNPNANNDIVGTAGTPIDPLLGPLADNGGPTETHELLTGSPAIDTGDPAFTGPPDFDQRGMGFPRIINGIVDIGAFEAQIGDLTVDKFPALGSDLTPLPGEQITYNIEVTVDGAANISDLSIEDIFPAELVGVEWSFTDSAGTPFMGTDDIEVDGVVLNAGDTITVTATGYLDCDLTSGSVIENTATVAIGGGDMDENPANNSDTDTSFSISANSPGVFGSFAFLSGTAGNDVIIGNNFNQTINGNFGNDSLYGSGGNDQLNGGFGDDLLVGGSGDDQISGGVGNDTLDGACTTLGVGQIDRLTGNGGFDYFILGNEIGAFYLGNGNQDFAYITDFNPGVDTIQLNGMLGDYTFMQTTVFANGINISGQGIFQGGDLVAILQQSFATPGDLVFVP
jgi:hypothetical protein